MTSGDALTPSSKVHMGLVASRFNQFIVDQLVVGACDALTRHGIGESERTLVWVPGAFELPLQVSLFY